MTIALSELLLPPPGMANCVSAAVYRDTLDVAFADADRLNYFPATPLFTVTRVFDGQLHVAAGLSDIGDLRSQPPILELSTSLPLSHPTCSWSPGGIRALTVAVYPDAWIALGGSVDGVKIPTAFTNAMTQNWTTLPKYWTDVCDGILPHWNRARQCKLPSAGWAGSHRLTDWARHVTARAALSGTGRSLRSVERRLRRWTGQSRQSIDFFAKIENLHAHRVGDPSAPLAEIAAAADFSDQSHMGRAVKRATGFSPARLNQMIETQEPFWCYRLLGERF